MLFDGYKIAELMTIFSPVALRRWSMRENILLNYHVVLGFKEKKIEDIFVTDTGASTNNIW